MIRLILKRWSVLDMLSAAICSQVIELNELHPLLILPVLTFRAGRFLGLSCAETIKIRTAERG